MSTPARVPLRQSLRDASTLAMKRRDRVTLSVCRTALAAIDNAEARPVGEVPAAGAIEASRVGVGAADAARRELSEAQIRGIVEAEIAERRAAARLSAGADAGRDRALLQEIDILESFLD